MKGARAAARALRTAPSACWPWSTGVFGIPRGAPFYAMMFGMPAVRYARTAYRHDGARVEFI